MTATKLAYGIASAAEQLDISEKQVRIEIEAGKLRAKKVGRKFLIPDDACRQWLDNLPDA